MDCWEFLLKCNCVVYPYLFLGTQLEYHLLWEAFLIAPSFLPLRPSQLFHSLLSILCLNNLLTWDTVARWLTLLVEKQNSKSLPWDSSKSNYLWTPRRQKTRLVLLLNPSSWPEMREGRREEKKEERFYKQIRTEREKAWWVHLNSETYFMSCFLWLVKQSASNCVSEICNNSERWYSSLRKLIHSLNEL